MARFQVGEVLYGICFLFQNGEYDNTKPYVYHDMLVKDIAIGKLTVKEHHRVPDYWAKNDHEQKHDGFILSDEAGNIWYNQYPKAHYGQVTDENDRIFYLHPKTEEQEKDAINGRIVGEYNLLTDFVHDLNRGIRYIQNMPADKKANWQDAEKRLGLMIELDKMIRDKLLKEYELVLEEFVPYEKLSNHTKYRLIKA